MKIALTFDIERDFPYVLDTFLGVEDGIVSILKMLDNFNFPCTFFCTGTVVERFPDIIRLIDQKGHEIACHSLNHEHLRDLSFNECERVISQNKVLLEDVCQDSEVVGFRAPYLKPPLFLFEILRNLGFKYDSSIKSSKHLKQYQATDYQIQEFHPLGFSTLLRLPLAYTAYRNWIYNKKLAVLYFHPWEATYMKKEILNRVKGFNRFRQIMFRPDRIINTGDKFIAKITHFIKDSLSRGAEFVTLKSILDN
ncbi:MAG: polysaccharide deacetylase family protein [Promethearchaeota archaeon]|jgi:peptidoglycan/xylan/chitin deacetylase (PgdA/CDA1 family)